MSQIPSLALAFDILAVDKASKEFNAVGDAAENTGKRASHFGALMAGGLAAVGVAAIKFGKDSIGAFTEAQQSSAKLDAALAKFPATNDRSRASFDKLNSALATKTKFDDDATASGQAVLANFNLTGAQIQKLTPLLQDYAAQTGRDLPAAAEVLGKAVLGNGKALKEIGLNLKDTGDASGNLDQLMAGLSNTVGGFAEKQGKTAAGQAEILGNRFGEVEEKVGSKLVPTLTTLAGKLVDTINFMDRNSKVIIPLVAVTGAFAATLLAVNAALKAQATVSAAVTAVKALFTTATVAQAGATAEAAAAQTELDVAMTANPIGLVIAAVAGLAAGLVYAYKHSETFRNMINSVWDVLKKFIGFTPLGALIENFDKVRSTVEFLINKVEQLAGKLSHLSGLDKLSKVGGVLGKIPGFADGGVVPGFLGEPVLAVVHGGETIRNPRQEAHLRSGDGPAGVTQNNVINVTSGPDGMAQGRAVVLALRMIT